MSTTARNYRSEKSSKIAKRLQQDAINIYENAKRFHWTSEFINSAIAKLVSSDDYRRLQRFDSAFVYGSIETLRRLHWKDVVYSYAVKGRRLSIESAEYKAIPAEYVNANCADTGAFVYRDNIEAIFYAGEKSARQSVMD